MVLTGPESSGKTTLAKALANHFKTQYVPEFARTYLDNLDRPYKESDLLQIAKGQLESEDFLAKRANQFLFCDTSLLVIKIWSEYRFGHCHPDIIELIQTRPYNLYILCAPDIPWEPDPLRENPYDREVLYEQYRRELDSFGKKYVEVSGEHEDRMEKILSFIRKK